MSSLTPNINLTLPTGTENWKRSTINGNFTILDTKIGAVGNTSLQAQVTALNSQITAATIGTNYTSQSSLESDLTTFGNAMANQDVRNIYFTIGTGGAGVLAQQGYIGRMQRLSSGRYNIMVQSFGDPGAVIIANYRNSAWTWGSATITTLS